MVQPVLGEVDLDVAVLEAVGDGGHLQLHDRAELLAGQGAENDDVVQPVFWECCEVGCMSGRERALCESIRVVKIKWSLKRNSYWMITPTHTRPFKLLHASYLSHTYKSHTEEHKTYRFKNSGRK